MSKLSKKIVSIIISLSLVSMVFVPANVVSAEVAEPLNIQFNGADDCSNFAMEPAGDGTVISIGSSGSNYLEGYSAASYGYKKNYTGIIWYFRIPLDMYSKGIDIAGTTHVMFDIYIKDVTAWNITGEGFFGLRSLASSEVTGLWDASCGQVKSDTLVSTLSNLKNGWQTVIMPIDTSAATQTKIWGIMMKLNSSTVKAGFSAVVDDIRFVNQAYLDSYDYQQKSEQKEAIIKEVNTGELVLGFESVDRFSGQFGTSVSLNGSQFRQGTHSVVMNNSIRVGQSANVGGMAIYDFANPVNLSKYKAFSLDIYLCAPYNMWGRHGFQVNFASEGQDGYNFNISLENSFNGWVRLYFGGNNYRTAGTTSATTWSSIDKIRFTWFNYAQNDMIAKYILLDNLVGYTDGLTPEVDDRNFLVLGNFENGMGLGSDYGTLVRSANDSDFVSRGNASLEITSLSPVNQTSDKIGTLAYITYGTPANISKYDHISFDLKLDVPMAGKSGKLVLDYITRTSPSDTAQTGFRQTVNLEGLHGNWHTITANKAELEKVRENATWEQIDSIRIIWYNTSGMTFQKFHIDDFVAYNMEDYNSQEYKISSNIATEAVLGDLTGDLKIGSVDALYALQHSVKKIKLTGLNNGKGDVDGDGSITVHDALRILQCAVELVNDFPYDEGFQTEINRLLGAKATMRFDSNREFKVLQVSDLHHGDNSGNLYDQARSYITKLVDNTKPNFVMFAGDILSTGNKHYNGNYVYTRANIHKFFSQINDILAERNIYWAYVFGNHDSEFAVLNKFAIYDEIKSLSHCLAVDGYVSQDRVGNYVIPILANDSNDIVFNLYCLDTGTYGPNHGGFSSILPSQVEWYKRTSKAYNKITGHQVPAIMMGHIPLSEFDDIYNNPNNYSWRGYMLDTGCGAPEYTDHTMFNAIKEMGDVLGYYCGHDHWNAYIAEYDGIELGYDGCINCDSYGGVGSAHPETAGGLLFTINQSAPKSYTSQFIEYQKLK